MAFNRIFAKEKSAVKMIINKSEVYFFVRLFSTLYTTLRRTRARRTEDALQSRPALTCAPHYYAKMKDDMGTYRTRSHSL